MTPLGTYARVKHTSSDGPLRAQATHDRSHHPGVLRKPRGQDRDAPEVRAGLRTLLEGFESPLQGKVLDLPQPLHEENHAVIVEYMEDVVDQLGREAYGAAFDVIGLFCDFAEYVEQTYPQVDVAEFLRQAGIRAADE